MTTHTPGPWLADCGHLSNGKTRIGFINREEDTRLIAAAPDMLAALKDLVRASDGHPDLLAARRYARSVIAKAEGEKS